MRYSLVLATLAASAIATPYINVEVSEPEAVVEITNNNDHHHRVNHGHNGNRDRDHHRRRGWLSTLFGGQNNEDDDENRRRNGRNGRGRNDRGRNDRGRNDRGRNGRGGRDGRRGDGRDYNDNDEFYTSIDEISGNNYECTILASSSSDEKDGANECCRQVGGELYDVRGRCVFRNTEENPRDEWRNCALEQRGTDFAECYKREEREVNDELDSENRRRFHVENSEDRDNRRDGRDGRDHNRDGRDRRDGRDGRDHNRDGRNGRDGRDGRDPRDGEDRRHRDQSVLGNQDDREDRRRHDNEQYECRLRLNNEDLERDITRQCCNERDVQGRLRQNDERCEVRQGREADRFEDCAARLIGAREDDVQCRRTNDRRDL